MGIVNSNIKQTRKGCESIYNYYKHYNGYIIL